MGNFAKKDVDQLITILDELYPNPKATLIYRNAFELLVAVILSAQCTDKRVNEVTRKLFPKNKTCAPEHILKLGEEKLKNLIYSTGYHNAKTKAIMGCAKKLKDKEVPSEFKELTALPGIGAKSAQVIQSQWFDIPAFPVDTHVHRVCNRLGLANSGNNRSKTEQQVKKLIPKEHWGKLHLQIIFHGRETCTARKAKCKECALKEICKWPRKKQKAFN